MAKKHTRITAAVLSLVMTFGLLSTGLAGTFALPQVSENPNNYRSIQEAHPEFSEYTTIWQGYKDSVPIEGSYYYAEGFDIMMSTGGSKAYLFYDGQEGEFFAHASDRNIYYELDGIHKTKTGTMVCGGEDLNPATERLGVKVVDGIPFAGPYFTEAGQEFWYADGTDFPNNAQGIKGDELLQGYETGTVTDITVIFDGDTPIPTPDPLVPGGNLNVPVTGIELNRTNINLPKGGSFQLVATVLPEDARDRSVTWSVDNSGVASVDQTGLVNATYTGGTRATTTVTVTTRNGISAMCSVNVGIIGPTANGIYYNPVGDPEKVYELVDQNGNPVDKNGNPVEEPVYILDNDTDGDNNPVTSLAGSALDHTDVEKWDNGDGDPTNDYYVEDPQNIFRPIDHDGSVIDTPAIWGGEDGTLGTTDDEPVKKFDNGNGTNADDYYIDNGDNTFVPVVNKDRQPLVGGGEDKNPATTPAKPIYEDSAGKHFVGPLTDADGYEYYFGDPENGNGLLDSESDALKGDDIIWYKDENGNMVTTVACKSISMKSSTRLTIGTEETLVVEWTPGNTSDKSLTWKSSNELVAVVDNGTIIGTGVGAAVITATTSNGKTARCTVVVVAEDVLATSVIPSESKLDMEPGDIRQLTATVKPDNATNQGVTWSSSDPEVVTVDPNSGLVTAKKPGTATITVTTSNGKTAVVPVTVTAAEVPVTGLSVSPVSKTIAVGGTTELTATVAPSNATTQTVTWSSSDSTVAFVNGDGKVTGVKSGTVQITASCGGKTASAVITVTEVETPAESIALNKTSVSMEVGKVETLTATVKPDNASVKSVSWKSSNEAVAFVDQSGAITAMAQGTAMITVTSHNGLTATCKVTVSADLDPATGVTLDKGTLTMELGGAATLTATTTPAGKAVTWSSSNSAVVAVDASGNLTATGEGMAVITAATANGKTATCKVTVTDDVNPTTDLTLSPESATMAVGTTKVLTAATTPAGKTVAWASSNPAVVTVDANGKVTATATGMAVITASSGSHSKTCVITVVADADPATSVTLNKDSLTMEVGEAEKLTATTSPAGKNVTYSSSNPAVAVVDADGNVTATGEGMAVITVATPNGKTATCTVTVTADKAPATSITLSPASATVGVGATKQLTATTTPAGKAVTYTSSNPAVAAVDFNGLVTGASAGVAIITASTASGKTATSTITVVADADPATTISIDPTAATLSVGATRQLTATTTPAGKAVTWSSSNEAVAHVSDTGLVIATSEGIAIITAATANGKSAICTVTVTPPSTPVTGLMLNKSSTILTAGSKETLVATVLPADATNKIVTWSTTNAAIASVSSSGEITAVSAGTATITATAADGGMNATCNVTVNPLVVPATGLLVDKESMIVNGGEMGVLTATVLPSNSTDTVTTTVSDQGIITAYPIGNPDASGNVRIEVYGWGAGRANLTVQAGSHTKTIPVLVPLYTPYVNVSTLYLEVPSGHNATFTAGVLPGTTDELTITSSDETIATATLGPVDANGNATVTVNGWGTGTAYLTLRAGNATAEVKIFVPNPATGLSVSTENLLVVGGATAAFTVNVSPANTTDAVTVSSNNEGSATASVSAVDGNGNATVTVNGWGWGTSVITVTAGGHSRNVTVATRTSDYARIGDKLLKTYPGETFVADGYAFRILTGGHDHWLITTVDLNAGAATSMTDMYGNTITAGTNYYGLIGTATMEGAAATSYFGSNAYNAVNDWYLNLPTLKNNVLPVGFNNIGNSVVTNHETGTIRSFLLSWNEVSGVTFFKDNDSRIASLPGAGPWSWWTRTKLNVDDGSGVITGEDGFSMVSEVGRVWKTGATNPTIGHAIRPAMWLGFTGWRS